MNDTDTKSRPLELTPLMWVAIGIVALVGVVAVVDQEQSPRTLDYLSGEKPVIIRSTSETHRFPFLGVAITLPEGWSYLSVTDDAVAEKPSFVHEETGSILRLQRFGLETWPPAGAEMTSMLGGRVEWVQIDHRRLGRLSLDELDLALIAITHKRGVELNDSINLFCEGIQRLSDGE
ncbi:MAG: hypothetical protein ACR2NZ_18060 [Rubripirellula sp.]